MLTRKKPSLYVLFKQAHMLFVLCFWHSLCRHLHEFHQGTITVLSGSQFWPPLLICKDWWRLVPTAHAGGRFCSWSKHSPEQLKCNIYFYSFGTLTPSEEGNSLQGRPSAPHTWPGWVPKIREVFFLPPQWWEGEICSLRPSREAGKTQRGWDGSKRICSIPGGACAAAGDVVLVQGSVAPASTRLLGWRGLHLPPALSPNHRSF